MRHRQPLAKAKLTGASAKNPQRYRDVSDPKVDALGNAPAILSADEREVWQEIASDIPWLKKSDAMLLAITCKLSVLSRQPGCPVAVYAQLRLCLASMGGTPTDRGRIALPADDDCDDPAAEWLN